MPGGGEAQFKILSVFDCSLVFCRLKDYPQYCQHLASIGHFLQFPHHLQEVNRFPFLLDGHSELPQFKLGVEFHISWDFRGDQLSKKIKNISQCYL